MAAEQPIIRLLLSYQDIWFARFPALSRRAEWHIVHHLCTKGRDGSPVGALYGLVKQIFLLDDATVKERLLSLNQLGLCELDSGQQIYARTTVVPTPVLLNAFDAHLLSFGTELAATAGSLGMPNFGPLGPAPTTAQRGLLLRPLEVYADAFTAALDRIFAATRLSPARRLEAKRNLISPSHWNLLHNAVRFQQDAAGPPAQGILADRLAAQLLQLTGQTLQTTRDHIAYLMEAGLFQRMKGRSLHISVSPEAMTELRLAIKETAQALPPVFQALADTCGASAARTQAAAQDLTATIPSSRPSAAAPESRHFLDVEAPAGAETPICIFPPATLGRTPPAEIVVQDGEISRNHCRFTEEDGGLIVSDLKSTNGTFVNGHRIDAATTLHPGDQLRLGTHVLVYRETQSQAGGTAAPARSRV